jgi:hypothetical protein
VGAGVHGHEIGVRTQAVAGALDLDHHGVVQQPVEQRGIRSCALERRLASSAKDQNAT